MNAGSLIARRMRCAMNHALLYVILRVRWSWCALIPFLEEHRKKNASSHLFNGMWDPSKIVPTVTVYCLRHAAHFHKRRVLDFNRYGVRSHSPQCGHTGPSGQRMDSRYAAAASALWKRGSRMLRSKSSNSSLGTPRV